MQYKIATEQFIQQPDDIQLPHPGEAVLTNLPLVRTILRNGWKTFAVEERPKDASQ
jgi:hypothetical protein